MSNNFIIFSHTKQILVKIQLKYPTIFTFYVLYGIFEQIYRHIASNTVNFTYCADKVEKILLVVAQFHYLFIFQRIIGRSRKVLFDDCYLIICLSVFRLCGKKFLTIFSSIWIMKFCRSTFPNVSNKNTAFLGCFTTMPHPRVSGLSDLSLQEIKQRYCGFFHYKFI